MHGCSCKKLIFPFLLCLVLAGCATSGSRESREPSLPGFIPGGCSTYLAGKVEALPDMFAEIFEKNGIPDTVIKNTERIYCCFVTPDRITVFLEGNYKGIPAKTYFNTKKRYSKKFENGFEYYTDQETGASFCLPGKTLIIYTEDDMQKLLADYNPDSYLISELDGLYTQDLFVFRDNPSIQDLRLKRRYQVYLWANITSGFYSLDSDLCFATEKDARVASPVVKLFINNLIKKIEIEEYNTGRPVSTNGERVQIRGIIVPQDKGSPVFEYFISELDER
ncbi:MAG: hypothetical protein IJG75_03750 [Spirochaetia bacterium]|nr:hypothetical protein [Spirochaetia bacterium]